MFMALKRLSGQGHLIVAVTHDWNLAARWATRLVLLKQGRIAAAGRPEELAQESLLEKVFGAPLSVLRVEGQPPVVLDGGGHGA